MAAHLVDEDETGPVFSLIRKITGRASGALCPRRIVNKF
jgi:hypothetical protein